MRYHKPFTPKQRQHAIRICRALHAHFQLVRTQFPPRNPRERDLARRLRRSLQDLIDALRPSDAKVNVDRLNQLRDRTESLGMQYTMLQYPTEEP
jgi:hypothetical protein